MYKRKFSIFICILFMGTASFASLETPAKQVYLYDTLTKTVLFSKNAKQKMYPASMTKLMTVYLVFEKLKKGTLSLDTKFLVSEKAWKKGGSKMFVKINSLVKVSDLLRGVIVQSGNDAAIVLAEGIAGTEEAFAQLMTEKARQLGMNNTNFKNATGWPDPDHYTTAQDLAILIRSMIKEFPKYYPMWSEKVFTYNGIKQHNRNPLLSKNIGADGLKTGHTKISGYGLSASLKKDNRRIIMVLHGMKSEKERAKESYRLALKALYNYRVLTLIKKGDILDNAPVWQGQKETVPLIVKEDIVHTISIDSINKIHAKIVYSAPLRAPLNKGDVVGKVVISVPNTDTIYHDVYAGQAVKKSSLFKRFLQSVNYFLWGVQ